MKIEKLKRLIEDMERAAYDNRELAQLLHSTITGNTNGELVLSLFDQPHPYGTLAKVLKHHNMVDDGNGDYVYRPRTSKRREKP